MMGSTAEKTNDVFRINDFNYNGGVVPVDEDENLVLRMDLVIEKRFGEHNKYIDREKDKKLIFSLIRNPSF